MSKTLSIDRYAYLDPGAQGMPCKVRVNALKRVPERDRCKPPRVCRYCRLVPSARHQLAEALRREIDERVDDVRIYALQPQGEGTYQGPAPLPPGLVLPGLSLRPQFPEAD